jgi:hypothetical protein
MVNGRELVDRFGDVEFLNELWQKARGELPHRLDDVRPYMLLESVTSPEDLGKRLHKLRGLVSNFLTEKTAIPSLVQCETLVEQQQTDDLPQHWSKFESMLDEEVNRLNRWLAEHGYS